MRTAILFSGTAYNYKYSIDSLFKNLIFPNNADVFILTSHYNMRRRTVEGTLKVNAEDAEGWAIKNRAQERNEANGITTADINFIKDTFGDHLKVFQLMDHLDGYAEYINGEREKMMDTVNKYRAESLELKLPQPFGSDVLHSDNGNVRAIIDQYNHVKRCFELMEEYENANGFKYDIVARVRIDFICPFKFDFSHYYLNQDYHYLYNCGMFRQDPFEWADEFCFFSHRDTAQRVFKNLNRMGFITDRKYNTVYFEQGNDFIFAPECQWSLLLYELDVKALPIKIFRSACYTKGGDGWEYYNYMFRREIKLDHEYLLVCQGPSDINEHLPVLNQYASLCEHITELGTRFGNSTVAFMAARPKKFITYEVAYNNKLEYLDLIAKENGINYECRIENPQEIEETDLLFIDTDHHVEQCSKELKLHADKVRMFLIFHDVVSFWDKGQGHEYGGGLRECIEPFMRDHPEWKQRQRFTNNNGLLILERC